MTKCSCWHKYPNELHKKGNGKWKCVDEYQCVRELVERTTAFGQTVQIKKTVCERKEAENGRCKSVY